MSEADEIIEETKKRLVALAVKREGDRVNVTETVSFEGIDYVTEYSSSNSGGMSVLCENLSIERDLPKSKYSSDPDPISETVIVGDGTLVHGGATSYGELGKLYRNNRVSFRIRRSKNERTCYFILDDADNTKLDDAWEKLRNQIEVLPENNNRYNIYFERQFNELVLNINLPFEEFDRIISYSNYNADQKIIIKCEFEINSGVFSKYDHFKIPAKWEEELYEEFIDRAPQANCFSFHFYQVIKGDQSRIFHTKEISHFPILKNIIGSRKFHKKVRIFSEKMNGYLTFSAIIIIWIGGSFYISETVFDFAERLFNNWFS